MICTCICAEIYTEGGGPWLRYPPLPSRIFLFWSVLCMYTVRVKTIPFGLRETEQYQRARARFSVYRFVVPAWPSSERLSRHFASLTSTACHPPPTSSRMLARRSSRPRRSISGNGMTKNATQRNATKMKRNGNKRNPTFLETFLWRVLYMYTAPPTAIPPGLPVVCM